MTNFLLLTLLVAGQSLSAGDREDVADSAVIHLANGGYVTGKLLASKGATVGFQSPLFTLPFDFAWGGISMLQLSPRANPPKPEGKYCFELSSGDMLFGDLKNISEKNFEITNVRLGTIHVHRNHVRRFYRWNGGTDLLYVGPYGLDGWKDHDPKGKWKDDRGAPFTDQSNATLLGDFKLPPQAVIEVEISWKATPNFSLALGVDANATSQKQPFKLETWENDLVVQRRTEREADVTAVQEIAAAAGRAQLQLYLDQEHGRLWVVSTNGTLLADLSVTTKKPRTYGGISLTNVKGDVRLERLRISRWNGAPPLNVQGNKSRLQLVDGTVNEGDLVDYDADKQQFSIRHGDDTTTVSVDRISNVFVTPPNKDNEETGARGIRISYQEGSRLSGELKSIDKHHISFTSPAIEEALELPLVGLHSVAVLRADGKDTAPKSSPVGTLEAAGIRLRGHLKNGKEHADASCLVWQPEFSTKASPMRSSISGRIEYRQVPATLKPPPTTPPRVVQLHRGRKVVTSNDAPPSTVDGPRFLHLRSGDVVPCNVSAMNEEGIIFKTPLSDATFVAHDKIKAVELIPSPTPPKLNKLKRERLLTLPRMQRDSPPTQLIYSRNGDFLRGRVLEMDDRQLKVEVRLDVQVIPREFVSKIIWLHAEEMAKPSVADEAAPPKILSPHTRVQAFRSDGIRLTFHPREVVEKTISGESVVLGACQTDLATLDQLLIGETIEKNATEMAYLAWKMHHALEPKFAQNEDGQDPGNSKPGTASLLVGKPAPKIELSMLGGEKFCLADCKGEIVVLDFWATWCGPCLQVMPQVERAVQEFSGQKVRLVAVNLEESPPQIKSTLERHKIKVPVALDIDGVTAARYEATAIPQTVVVDRAGNVARLFIGGGPRFEEQLRNALKEVIESNRKDDNTP